MLDERRQQPRVLLELRQLLDHTVSQFVAAHCRPVRPPTVLGSRPHQLSRVQLRSVSWKRLCPDLRGCRQVLPHKLRPAVNIASVPHHGQRTTQLNLKRTQKVGYLRSMHVGLVRPQGEVQLSAALLRTHRDGADRRDSITSVQGSDEGGTPRGPQVRRTVGVRK
jgi:hypothetical protein